MKTGLIIYVVGNDAANFINDVTLQGQIPAWADIVEIAIQNNGHYDIHDAWLKLMARGMQRIICKSEIEALDAIKTLRDRDKPFKKIILGFNFNLFLHV